MDLLGRIEEDVKILHNESLRAAPGELDEKWKFLTSREPGRFIRDERTIDPEALANFRKDQIFISDAPVSSLSMLHAKNLISGGKRGLRRLLRESFELVESLGFLPLLEKHPCSRVGNPYVFSYRGHDYTFRWLRHIIFLGQFERVLAQKVGAAPTVLDIGSSYGIFSYLLKRHIPGSHNVLLDFPEQLLLAYYFLGTAFPEAKIAGYKEVVDRESIDRDFIAAYDFVLLPWWLYDRVEPNAIDVLTNFASLGEMKREWFDYYLDSEPFLSTKYFYCVNRFQSWPTYDTDLSVLDYPLNDFEAMHFQISPYFSHVYDRKNVFFYQKVPFSSQYFEFIGQRR